MSKSTREEYNAYMREYMRDRYHAQRSEWIRLLGGACVECGETNNLEIDHKDPKQKSFTIGGQSWSKTRADILDEVGKCQLLCKKCHQLKTNADCGFTPDAHGTANMYSRHKCRCNICRTAHSARTKRYKLAARLRRANTP